MVVALIGAGKKGETVIGLLGEIEEDLDKDFLFFYTQEEAAIANYQAKIEELSSNIPAIFAQCGTQTFVYPEENPLVASALETWLKIIRIKVSGNIPVTEDE